MERASTGETPLWCLRLRSPQHLDPASSPRYRVLAHAWDVAPFGSGGGYAHTLLVEGSEESVCLLADSLVSGDGARIEELGPAADGHYRNEYPQRLVTVRDGQVQTAA